jgi:acyl-CoA thioesterase-1
MKIPFITLLVTAAHTFTSVAADAPAAKGARFIQDLQAGKKVTIVTMGTSLSNGWPVVMMGDWLTPDFPGQVTFFSECVGASSTAMGPNGDRSLSGLGKIPAAIAHRPDVVFIAFGMNDAYLPYNTSLEESKKNLNTIIDAILSANPKTEIILQTMNSCLDQDVGDKHASLRPRLAEYYQIHRDVAKERNLLLVDHYPNWLKLITEDPASFDKLVPDRVHPGAWGYFTVFLPTLKTALMPK